MNKQTTIFSEPTLNHLSECLFNNLMRDTTTLERTQSVHFTSLNRLDKSGHGAPPTYVALGFITVTTNSNGAPLQQSHNPLIVSLVNNTSVVFKGLRIICVKLLQCVTQNTYVLLEKTVRNKALRKNIVIMSNVKDGSLRPQQCWTHVTNMNVNYHKLP